MSGEKKNDNKRLLELMDKSGFNFNDGFKKLILEIFSNYHFTIDEIEKSVKDRKAKVDEENNYFDDIDKMFDDLGECNIREFSELFYNLELDELKKELTENLGVDELYIDKEKDEIISKGNKNIHRLVKRLKKIGIDIDDLEDKEHQKLLSFLYKVSIDKKIRYMQLFKPSYENLEYLSEEEKTINGDLMLMLQYYLKHHIAPEFIVFYEAFFLSLFNTEKKLLNCLYDTCFNSEENFLKNIMVADIMDNALKNIEEDFQPYTIERKMTGYEKMYVMLLRHQMDSLQADNSKLYTYIKNLYNGKEKENFENFNLIVDIINPEKDELSKYARKNKDLFLKILKINEKVFEKKIDIIDSYSYLLNTPVNGLYILSMAEEVLINFRGNSGKNVSKSNNFYRYKTKDMNKTFAAALKNIKESSFYMQEILRYRLNALYYNYFGEWKSYFMYLSFEEGICINHKLISQCTEATDVLRFISVLIYHYKNAIEIIENNE